MKKAFNPTALPLLTLGLGGIGLVLRVWLYSTGVDESGLLSQGHPAAILLWPLNILILALLLWQCRSLAGYGRHSVLFPDSVPAAVGCWVAAVGILITALSDMLASSDLLHTLNGIAGLLCFPALLFAGYCRFKDIRPSFLFHVVPCVYFALRLICISRAWTSAPQLQDYCFQLLAHVCLMLAAYYRACFDVNMCKRPSFVFFSLLAVFYCCLSLVKTDWPLFYLSAGFWVFTNLCTLKPLPKPQPQTTAPAPEESPTEESPQEEL